MRKIYQNYNNRLRLICIIWLKALHLIITSDCSEATLIFSPNMNQDGDILSLKVHRRTWTQKTVYFCCWRRVMKTFAIISIIFYYYYKVKDRLQASVLTENLLKNILYEFFLQVVFIKFSIVFILTICFMHWFKHQFLGISKSKV